MARRRKLKKKSLKSILVLLLIVGICFTSYFVYDNYFKSDNITTNNDDGKKPNKDKPNVPQDEVYKLKLLATGDGLIHSVIYRSYKTATGYDFSGALSEVADIVKDYDIAYYNQETPMGNNSIEYSGYPRFYAPKEYGDAMLNIGFNMVSLASNHSYDKGEAGVIKTLDYFDTTDVLYNGMNRTLEDANNYMIKEKNNITYTMLSYTTIDNGLGSLLGNKQYMVNKYSKEKVKADIEAVRDNVDVLVVAMHWGVEYQNKPNAEQLEIAEYLSSLGVDIIIGNHPHILQPITKIGDTIVMYSLGNFISNQYGTDDWNKLVGFLATLDITKTKKVNGDVEINIDNLGGELIFTKYNGNPINTAVHDGHKVIPFSKMHDDTYLKDYKRVFEKYSGVLTSMGTDLNITPCG